MTEYLLKMKAIIDSLASSGQKIFEEDQILHILCGLGPKYNALVVSLTLQPKQPKL